MMDFNLVWALGMAIVISTIVFAGIVRAIFHNSNDPSTAEVKPAAPALTDFSRGRVVQVFDGEIFTRLTHLVDKKKGLFNFAELQLVDKFGQPRGEPVLREGDFDDLINEVAGIPEGSLAFFSTPEFPDPVKPRVAKSQALKRKRYLPKPSIPALPAPTILQ
ncbi:MAG: hypothetical protein ACYC9J_06420 [Sulfuricaulis sp.]